MTLPPPPEESETGGSFVVKVFAKMNGYTSNSENRCCIMSRRDMLKWQRVRQQPNECLSPIIVRGCRISAAFCLIHNFEHCTVYRLNFGLLIALDRASPLAKGYLIRLLQVLAELMPFLDVMIPLCKHMSRINGVLIHPFVVIGFGL